MSDRFSVTIVNHLGLDIGAAPERVWQELSRGFMDATRFREAGYAVEPIDDPAYALGGYRIRIEQDGTVDERVICITECDEAARCISVVADYLSVEGGLTVYASYRAQNARTGARLTVDCHSRTTIETQPGESGDIAAAVVKLKADYDAGLLEGYGKFKARIEADL